MNENIHMDAAVLEPKPIRRRKRKVAKVLLADTGLASRLTLKTILNTAGYAVTCAATAPEAIEKLDESEYQLVLADLRAESEEAGSRLLAYARQKQYRPATALICSDMREMSQAPAEESSDERVVRISDENVSYLLAKVAELISHRADRRIRQSFRRAS